jgi:NAD(P)-dependent dehydrogenase (short-subunit alcohol dehydrogenase family)
MNDQKISKRLDKLAVLITGGGRGIGRAIAIRFAQEGADLFLCATRMDTLQETRRLAAVAGRKIELYAVDVRDRAAVEKMVQTAIDTFGRIDVLVNNAGIYKPALFVDYTPEDFDNIMKVNVYGPFHVSQFILKHMLPRRKGKIVNIASTAGKWASINQSAYNISKHALVGMTRCLALETAKSGITVNAICPGVVETDMLTETARQYGIDATELIEGLIKPRIAMERLIQPEEVAQLAVYLASGESDGMTGQSIVIDGGMVYV